MIKNAIVFSGRNGLDFMELRTSVLRIPDVTLRIREAQSILDTMIKETVKSSTAEGGEPVYIPQIDLLSTISSDDEFFFRNIQLKSLTAAIVQVGLYDRYLRTQRRPSFMLGNSNGDSAMMVAAGRMTFKEMVETSQAAQALKPQAEQKVVSLVAQPLPLLSGLNLTEYSALEYREGAYHSLQGNSMELRRMVASLNDEFGVERFVNVGPAAALRASDYRSVGLGDIESLDSIEMDPMLSWFWGGLRNHAIALAQ